MQLDAYRRGVAALLKHMGSDASLCVGHKEWAPARKPDPFGWDMNAFRDQVHRLLHGALATRPLIPAQDPVSSQPTLRRGARGKAVKLLQAGLAITADGIFGVGTEAHARAFQRSKGLVPDGIVGPKTWALLLA